MIDRRTTPDRAFQKHHRAAQIAANVVDLCTRPNGPRDRQLIFGEPVTEFSSADGWSYVQSHKDNYCGFMRSNALQNARVTTHHVHTRASHIYESPDFKSANKMALSFGVKLAATNETEKFIETDLGFVPRQHVKPKAFFADDPACIAQIFLGTPYLWGGNTQCGIDCSGLVQSAFIACGIHCPGDSDQQLAQFGRDVGTQNDFRRNDLLFWKGHVAIALGADMLIHANAAHMAVTIEPISNAIERIKAQGDGPVIGHKRV